MQTNLVLFWVCHLAALPLSVLLVLYQCEKKDIYFCPQYFWGIAWFLKYYVWLLTLKSSFSQATTMVTICRTIILVLKDRCESSDSRLTGAKSQILIRFNHGNRYEKSAWVCMYVWNHDETFTFGQLLVSVVSGYTPLSVIVTRGILAGNNYVVVSVLTALNKKRHSLFLFGV